MRDRKNGGREQEGENGMRSRQEGGKEKNQRTQRERKPERQEGEVERSP